MKSRDRSLSARGVSVSQDWCSCLTEPKSAFFDACEQDYQANYYMLGVTLNDASVKCQAGKIASSLQSISLAPALCARWTVLLSALLRSLTEHAKHYGTLPNTAPLQPRHFQSMRAQSSARMNALLSHVLLSQRSQFLRKIGTLLELAEDLSEEFSASVSDLAEDAKRHTLDIWDLVDALGRLHFDINTCCAEALILLKSFLVALPENQLLLFQKTYQSQLRAAALSRQAASEGQRALRNGRFVSIRGE